MNLDDALPPAEVIVAGLQKGYAKLGGKRRLPPEAEDFLKRERDRLRRERADLRTFERLYARMTG